MREQRRAAGHSRNGIRELLPWYLSGWLLFGILWGVVLGDASRHANQNYDRIVGAMKQNDAFDTPYYVGFAIDATMLALTMALAVFYLVYLLIGLLFFARRRSFWLTAIGVLMGMGGAGAMHKFFVAFGLFGRA